VARSGWADRRKDGAISEAILAGKKPTERSAERLWEFAYQHELTFDDEEARSHP
jgi:hypothetical protein